MMRRQSAGCRNVSGVFLCLKTRRGGGWQAFPPDRIGGAYLKRAETELLGFVTHRVIHVVLLVRMELQALGDNHECAAVSAGKGGVKVGSKGIESVEVNGVSQPSVFLEGTYQAP